MPLNNTSLGCCKAPFALSQGDSQWHSNSSPFIFGSPCFLGYGLNIESWWSHFHGYLLHICICCGRTLIGTLLCLLNLVSHFPHHLFSTTTMTNNVAIYLCAKLVLHLRLKHILLLSGTELGIKIRRVCRYVVIHLNKSSSRVKINKFRMGYSK